MIMTTGDQRSLSNACRCGKNHLSANFFFVTATRVELCLCCKLNDWEFVYLGDMMRRGMVLVIVLINYVGLVSKYCAQETKRD